MTTTTLEIAQKTLAKLIEDVVLGEHVIITKDHKPVAEIIPISRFKHKPKFGSAKGMINLSEDFDAPLEDFREYVK